MISSRVLFLSLSATLVFSSSVARSENRKFTTWFEFMMFGPDGQTEVSMDPVKMPKDLSEWACRRKPPVTVDTVIQESLICRRGDYEVGIGLTCPIDGPGQDSQMFWLYSRARPEEVGVMFHGHCTTALSHRVDDGF
jgi:hypothetical protein